MTWPGTPPAWLVPWAIWRFRGSGSRPAGTPKEIPKWAHSFLKWCAWRRKGADPDERPTGLPARIPQWAWAALKSINQAVPVVPPPPPPPPPPVVDDSWQLPNPLVFFAWGTALDWRDSGSFTPVVERFVNAGMRTAALQIGQSSPWQADILRQFGAHVCMWGVASTNDQAALDAHQAEGYMPQVEGVYERDPAIDNFRAGIGTGLSKALVTTFAGLEEGQMAWFEAEGCTVAYVETYAQTGGNRGDVPVMMHQAHNYGIRYALPVPAIYWDVPLTSYDLDAHGEQVGVWSAEFFDAQDLADMAAL